MDTVRLRVFRVWHTVVSSTYGQSYHNGWSMISFCVRYRSEYNVVSSIISFGVWHRLEYDIVMVSFGVRYCFEYDIRTAQLAL